MPDANTTHYGWVLPEVGSSAGTWGTKLNTNFSDIDTDLKAVSDALDALTAALAVRTGKLDWFLDTSAPAGWIKANGGTIGNASSGGTTRANADTSALFAKYWALDATDFPVYDSGGTLSSRGANAAADFAANKRILIEDFRSEYVRGFDDSRGVNTQNLGAWKDGQMPSHTHSAGFVRTTARFDASNDGVVPTNTGGLATFATGSAGGTDNSSENRVRAIARLACIKL